MNYDETNGILIGPEFSRIFAEIILQRIDKNVEIQLTKEEAPIIHHKDYVCFRYVDDYFVFFSDDSIKDKIFKNFKLALGEYKLTVSEAKTQLYSKPIITELTIAKLKIAELLEGDIHFRIEKEASLGDIDIEDYQAINNDVFKVYVNSNRLAAKFKSILIESKVEYKEVLNYSLSIIERKIGSILNKFDDYFKQLTKLSNGGELDDKQIQIKYNREKCLHCLF